MFEFGPLVEQYRPIGFTCLKGSKSVALQSRILSSDPNPGPELKLCSNSKCNGRVRSENSVPLFSRSHSLWGTLDLNKKTMKNPLLLEPKPQKPSMHMHAPAKYLVLPHSQGSNCLRSAPCIREKGACIP